MKLSFDEVIRPFAAICEVLSDSVDMIQAGGGNASAKYSSGGNAEMLIKASGFLMSEVDIQKGYTRIALKEIQEIIEAVKTGSLSVDDEAEINARTAVANLGDLRPSIETFLHALIPQRYVLHVHALTTLIYASSKRFILDLEAQWQDEFWIDGTLLIPYEKPGVHLAMAMASGIDRYKAKYQTQPSVVILQNHGLIVTSEYHEAMVGLIVKVENKIKDHMGLGQDFDKAYRDQYKIKVALKNCFKEKRIFVRLNEDRDLVNYIDGKPCFPDALVFCGLEPLVFDSSFCGDLSSGLETGLTAYHDKYFEFPKVIIVNSTLYFCGESIKKCLEVQDVLKIQGILRRELNDELNTLSDEQSVLLLNWEAEKYRKSLV